MISALTTNTLTNAITFSPVTISAGNFTQAGTAFQLINSLTPGTWASSNSANVFLTSSALSDVVLDPTSAAAQVNVTAPADQLSQLSPLFNVNNGGTDPGLEAAATVAVFAAIALIGGTGLGTAGASAVVDISEYVVEETATIATAETGTESYIMAFTEDSGIAAAGAGTGVTAGLISGGAAGLSYVDVGGSPP